VRWWQHRQVHRLHQYLALLPPVRIRYYCDDVRAEHQKATQRQCRYVLAPHSELAVERNHPPQRRDRRQELEPVDAPTECRRVGPQSERRDH
jgi:hypothetical protein